VKRSIVYLKKKSKRNFRREEDERTLIPKLPPELASIESTEPADSLLLTP
jgi:hypothetical protein